MLPALVLMAFAVAMAAAVSEMDELDEELDDGFEMGTRA